MEKVKTASKKAGSNSIVNVSSVLSTILKKHRESLNRTFKEMAIFNRRIDGSIFLQVVNNYIAPVVEAVHNKDPEKSEEVTLELYSLALELYSRKYLGPETRWPHINRLWKKTLPALASLIAQSPKTLPSHLTNAVFTLTKSRPELASKWLEEIANIAPGCSDASELSEAGKVLAWRCGMAHWRDSAMNTWQRLSKTLKLATLGLLLDEEDYDIDELETSLLDRWHKPGIKLIGEKEICIIGRAGGFYGFDKEFVSPPEVLSSNNRIYVFDDQNCWSIHGDCFGIFLHPEGRDLPSTETSDDATKPSSLVDKFTITQGGKITWNGKKASIPLLKGLQSFACSKDFVAVTLPSTHAVFLLALTDRSAAIA